MKIIFFELLYLVKGNKGNKFTFSKNDMMTDNTPSPYYFLHRIKKIMSLLLIRKNEIIIITSSPTFVGFFVCGMRGRFGNDQN